MLHVFGAQADQIAGDVVDELFFKKDTNIFKNFYKTINVEDLKSEDKEKQEDIGTQFKKYLFTSLTNRVKNHQIKEIEDSERIVDLPKEETIESLGDEKVDVSLNKLWESQELSELLHNFLDYINKKGEDIDVKISEIRARKPSKLDKKFFESIKLTPSLEALQELGIEPIQVTKKKEKPVPVFQNVVEEITKEDEGQSENQDTKSLC
jgi:hypothetical protein